MNENKTLEGTKLQWHPAFYAGIQIEFEKEAGELIFESEHQLGTKPKVVDVLITKKNKNYQVKKNIGRFFKKYNLIEYKPPKDSLNIDDFYKICGYGCFYKANSAFVNSIKTDEITISFVVHSYPRKMIQNLKSEKRYTISEIEKGIYYINGGIFPIQLVVTRLISEKKNFWLWNLNNKLKTTKQICTEYQRHNKNKLYKSVMDIIVKANSNLFKEDNKMCQALLDLYKDELKDMIDEEVNKQVKIRLEEQVKIRLEEQVKIRLEEQVKIRLEEQVKIHLEEQAKQGALKTLFELYQDNLISLQEAARRASLTEQNFLDVTQNFVH